VKLDLALDVFCFLFGVPVFVRAFLLVSNIYNGSLSAAFDRWCLVCMVDRSS
jgi:hypothetical protein